ncbi:hypothetical protein HK436_30145, partial [Mesorhizobium sediminum]|nr:hypothetical protein [Mesorhizobium sediminum]
ERYYAGDSSPTTASNYLQVDDREMMTLVNEALALAGDPSAASRRSAAAA